MHKIIWGVPSFWIGRIPEYYAEDRGIFRNYGFHVNLEYFYGGPELCSAVNDGEVKVGSMGLPPFVKAYAEGMPARIIGSTVLQQLDHYLVARPDLKSMVDLRGKKIGILSFGSCDTYFIRHMLQKEGIDPEREVELIAMGRRLGGDLTCFSSGQIDAGFVIEPKISMGENLGLFHILAKVGDYYPRYQWGIIFANDKYLREHTDRVRQLVEAYREASREIKADPESAVELGSRIFEINEEMFRKALHRNLDNWAIDAKIDLKGLKNAITIQKEIDSIKKELVIEDMLYQM